jgi:hypothetical protein
MVNYNFATHVIYSLAVTMYKYSELQVFSTTHKIELQGQLQCQLQNTPSSYSEKIKVLLNNKSLTKKDRSFAK